MRGFRTQVLIWFAAVGLITLAIVPIRLYALSANDWLVGALSTLALVFFVIYFLIAWLWKPRTVRTPSVS
jgi:uncharacterized membrane protein